MKRALAAAAVALSLAAVIQPDASAAPSPALMVTDTASTYVVSDGQVGVSIAKTPWLLSLVGPTGTSLVVERSSTLPDQTTNQAAQANADFDQAGHDKAYPGLPTVSTRPLAYLRAGTWQHVTAFTSAHVSGTTATIDAATSDGLGATVRLDFRGPVVDLRFTPAGTAVAAVAETWQHAPTERFFGGGGRFLRPELTGLSVPLWVSHGIGADRYTYTNEIAVPYLSSTGGWAVADNGGARGELDISVPERPGSVSAVFEDDHLDLTLYSGSLQSMLTRYTDDTGRSPTPPEWAFTPMWWDDAENSQAEIDTNIAALRAEGMPVGAYWIDNPFQDHQGDFAPAVSRFPTFDSWLAGLHAHGTRLVTWVSPFYDPSSVTGKAGAVPVTGGPADRNDHTYVPARGINAHVDLTDATSYQAEVDAATALLKRGVDGFKMDRSEEDFADGAHFADGTPNRLEHSRYVLAYDRAMRQACTDAHPDGNCLLLARGGVGGSAKYVGNWAGDSPTVDGPVGLLPAIHHLLSEAMSGQPIWGSDVGGYSPRQGPVAPGTPPLTPQAGTFVRWAQFGAVSPIFESPNHPSDYDAATIAAIREAAVLHDRLAPYTHKAAVKAAADGTPIVQPLVLAHPGDPAAAAVDDEYIFDGCLLAAPLHTGVEQEGPAARTVYLPSGGWTNVFTGAHETGPVSTRVESAYDEFPLYEADGCDIPSSMFADLGDPAPAVPEAPAAVLLPLTALGAAALLVVVRRKKRSLT